MSAEDEPPPAADVDPPPGPPPPPPPPSRPRFSPVMTVLATLALGAAVGGVAFHSWAPSGGPEVPDAQPLERFDALIGRERIEAPLSSVVIAEADRFLVAAGDRAARAHDARAAAVVRGARVRLAIIRGEAARVAAPEADPELRAAGPVVLRVLRCAYGPPGPSRDECAALFAPAARASTLSEMRDRAGLWTGSRACLTAAFNAHAFEAQRRMLDEARRELAVARRWERRMNELTYALVALAVFAALALRRMPAPAPPPLPAPWSGTEIYAVLVRCGLFSILGALLVGGLLALARSRLMVASIAVSFYGFTLWSLQRIAFRRFGLDWRDGLRAGALSAGRLGIVALVALGMDHLGRTVIAIAAVPFMPGPAWSDVPAVLEEASAAARIIVVVTTVLLGPLVEELLFRRTIFGFFRQRWGATAALIASAALFGLVHFYSPVGTAMIAWAGLTYAWALHRSGSLWPGVAAHAASNALAVVATLG